jgi:hypothetical protein
LFINVGNFTEEKEVIKLNFIVEPKTNAKITGLFGKKGMLDIEYYKKLDKKSLELEEGFKIFLFHTGITEYKPKYLEEMDSMSETLLPKGFDYYAGGHVHYILDKNDENSRLVFPGPTFPNNFRELEDLKKGSFFIYENGKSTQIDIELCKINPINIDCNNKKPEEINQELIRITKDKEFDNTIVMIRMSGVLEEGKPSDINLKAIIDRCHDQNALLVMKKTGGLTTKEFKEVEVQEGSMDELEDKYIKEHAGQINIDLNPEEEAKLTKTLINLLDAEKQEGERVADFEERIIKNVEGILNT